MKPNFYIRIACLTLLLCGACSCGTGTQAPTLPEATYESLPRWRGFNLLEKFAKEPDEFSQIAPCWTFYNEPFRESDFEMIRELGFNFVRLPMSYKCWINGDDMMSFNEQVLREIDQAVEWGRKYGIHVSINMHRAPGYCINAPAEKYNLWTDDKMQKIFSAHWKMFAQRYKGIPSRELSFDLVNEPLATDEQYEKVIRQAVAAIREADPDRLIIIDGIDGGNRLMTTIDDLHVAQSGRGYQPQYVTHFKTSWNQWWNTTPEQDSQILPTWPYTDPQGRVWDKARFEELYAPWINYRDTQKRGVHIGEFGVNKYTPHDVSLAFLRDITSTFKEHNLGWALWQFRGPVGILDSERDDVIYESYKGHKLDRKMLEILQAN